MRAAFRLLLSLASIVLIPLAGRAATTDLVNNFAATRGPVLDVIQKQGIAQAFTTDNHTYRLYKLQVELSQPAMADSSVEFQLRANNDATGLPGAILEKWAGLVGENLGTQDINLYSVKHPGLSPNTKYWVVVRAVTGNQVSWSLTNDSANAGVGSTGGSVVTNNASISSPTWKPSGQSGVAIFEVAADPVPPALIASVGSGAGPIVKAFDPATQMPVSNAPVFDSTFMGGVRVAAADFDGDGIAETLVGAGPGGAPEVKLLRGSDGSVIEDFLAFAPTFTGGVFVAAGDVNGDGFPDMIVGVDAGAGPQVKVFSGKNGALLKTFFAFASNFTGGVRVAAADLDGDGCADIVCAAGPGGGPEVKVFSGKTGAVLFDFFAYDPGFHGGVFVACGDFYGSGQPAIATGPDAGASEQRVKVFSGNNLQFFQSFVPFDPSFTGGLRLSAGDLDGDGLDDLIVGAGPGASNPPRVKTLNVPSVTTKQDFSAFDIAFHGGVFVAGATIPKTEVCPIKAAGTGSGKVTGKFLKPLVHQGSATPDAAAIAPRLTEAFQLTATPARGSAFNGWTDSFGDILAYEETATFRMSPGLSVQANFIPAPFAGLDGTYDASIAFGSSALRGVFSATVDAKGALTAKVQIGTPLGIVPVPLPGAQFLGTGDFQRVVGVRGVGKFLLALKLDMDPTHDPTIACTLDQVLPPGSTDTPLSASFTASREEFQDGSFPAAKYTMLFTRDENAPDNFPAGVSSMRVNVTDKGMATFTGQLGDGTLLNAKYPIAAGGKCAFFLPLYNHKGYLAGTLTFEDVTDSDIDGTLTWFKPRLGSRTYPDGFEGDVQALGTIYAPTAGSRLILQPAGAGSLTLSAPDADVRQGGKPVDAPSIASLGSVTLDTDDFLHVPPDAMALKCKVKRANGTFGGMFKETIAGTAMSFSFTGVILLPKGNTVGQAGGTFIYGNRTGAATITP